MRGGAFGALVGLATGVAAAWIAVATGGAMLDGARGAALDACLSAIAGAIASVAAARGSAPGRTAALGATLAAWASLVLREVARVHVNLMPLEAGAGDFGALTALVVPTCAAIAGAAVGMRARVPR